MAVLKGGEVPDTWVRARLPCGKNLRRPDGTAESEYEDTH